MRIGSVHYRPFMMRVNESGRKDTRRNGNAIVSSVLNREEYHREQGEAFVEKAYGGSLPKMIAAFIQSKKLSAAQSPRSKP